MDIQDLPNTAHVGVLGVCRKQISHIVGREIRIGDDALRHTAIAWRVGQ